MIATFEDIARRWAAAKDEVARLKRERAALVCDHEDNGDDSPEYTGSGRGDVRLPTEPCWRATRIDPFTLADVPAVDLADWCVPCVARQSVQDKIAPARRALTTATRALLRAARRPPPV